VPFFVSSAGQLAGMLAARMAALPFQARDTVSHCGFECYDVLAGVRNYPAKARVNFASTRSASYFGNIARMKAATGQNGDAVPGLLN
jgi:hypothetical protein